MHRIDRKRRIKQDQQSNIQCGSLPNNTTSHENHSHLYTNLHGEVSSSPISKIAQCPNGGNNNLENKSTADIDKKLFWVESQIVQILQRRWLRAQQAEYITMNNISNRGPVPVFVPFHQANMNIHQAFAHP